MPWPMRFCPAWRWAFLLAGFSLPVMSVGGVLFGGDGGLAGGSGLENGVASGEDAAMASFFHHFPGRWGHADLHGGAAAWI